MQEKLTSSLEDYLEVICNYLNENKTVRAIDISKKLNVSRASVTEALKKLASKDLLLYDRYGSITMTEKGFEEAKKVISKHTTLQKFFEKVQDLIYGKPIDLEKDEIINLAHIANVSHNDCLLQPHRRMLKKLENFKKAYRQFY